MTLYGWKERQEWATYVRMRLRHHEEISAVACSHLLLVERTMQNEMDRKNRSIERYNAARKKSPA